MELACAAPSVRHTTHTAFAPACFSAECLCQIQLFLLPLDTRARRRSALAKAYRQEGKFQLNEMDDATETLVSHATYVAIGNTC